MHCDLVPGKGHSLPLHHLPAQPQYNPPGTLPPSKHLNPPCTRWSPFAQAASRCWWLWPALTRVKSKLVKKPMGPVRVKVTPVFAQFPGVAKPITPLSGPFPIR
ncbi:hypothetical protein CC79DRAFT_1335477 [Sarocladium strictum]